MDDSWGPWIEHDGKGCPITPGTMAEIEWGDGSSIQCINRGQSAYDAGVREFRPYSGPRWTSSWYWGKPGAFIPVIRYRIREPKGLTILERIASQPQDERIEA